MHKKHKNKPLLTTIRLTAAIILHLTLTGCGNLTEIKEFANASASLTTDTELTTRFRDTYQREQPYLTDQEQPLAQANDQKRQAIYADLLKIHHTLTLYMQTLAHLAGDDTYTLTTEIDNVAASINAIPDSGINENHVKALANLSKITSQWITGHQQKRAVRHILQNSDPHLQTLLNGMQALIRYYQKTNENEKNKILGFYEINIASADIPENALLITLAKISHQEKIHEYQQQNARYTETSHGIEQIRAGHQRLAAHANQLTGHETRAILHRIAQDIQTIKDKLR